MKDNTNDRTQIHPPERAGSCYVLPSANFVGLEPEPVGSGVSAAFKAGVASAVKTSGTDPASVPGSLSNNFRPGKKVTCRASGRTKMKHFGCYGGAAIQNLPSAPYWIDPDPCPAIAKWIARRRHKENTKGNSCESPEGDLRGSNQIPQGCANLDRNKKKVQKILKLLKIDRSLKPSQTVLPPTTCGALRKSVTAMYSGCQLTLADTLSIKTCGNAESQPCPYCEDLQVGEKMDQWKSARLARQECDEDHLKRFEHAFSANVERGWNLRAPLHPYVPNGAATESFTRREGGNWNTEGFSTSCRVEPVFTKGKYRIVTMYSGYNVSVLTPLHNSLYAQMKKKGWLLVGSPTDEKLRWLEAGTSGDQWLSFDYENATDNIKTVYVQRAVETLITKAEGLTEDEERCLRVVSNLSFDGATACSGQPMGSPMSFPLLCLINKTVVDLALTDLLSEGKISFKEWTGHRLLINGDDLVTKSTSSGSLPEAIFRNGREVGLRSNWDKTLVSPKIGEINSTCFENCAWQKKTNVSALWMAADVTDVIGYGQESTTSNKGLLHVVIHNVTRLARQKIKTSSSLKHDQREALLSSSKIRRALGQQPLSRAPKDTNLLPVVAMPDGYDLSREEEIASIRAHVTAVRSGVLWRNLACEKKKNKRLRKKIDVSECEKLARKGRYKLLKKKRPRSEQTVLSCFADRWKTLSKEKLLQKDSEVFRFDFTKHCQSNPFTAELGLLYGKSSICGLQQMIKTFKDKRKPSRPMTLASSEVPKSTFDLSLHREGEIVRVRTCQLAGG